MNELEKKKESVLLLIKSERKKERERGEEVSGMEWVG